MIKTKIVNNNIKKISIFFSSYKLYLYAMHIKINRFQLSIYTISKSGYPLTEERVPALNSRDHTVHFWILKTGRCTKRFTIC